VPAKQKAPKRTTAQGRHAAEELLPVRGLNVPCTKRAEGGEGAWVKWKGGGRPAARGALGCTARTACKRTAAQSWQAAGIMAPWVLLYVPAGQALQYAAPVPL
jgi:hypothetical protein